MLPDFMFWVSYLAARLAIGEGDNTGDVHRRYGSGDRFETSLLQGHYSDEMPKECRMLPEVSETKYLPQSMLPSWFLVLCLLERSALRVHSWHGPVSPRAQEPRLHQDSWEQSWTLGHVKVLIFLGSLE